MHTRIAGRMNELELKQTDLIKATGASKGTVSLWLKAPTKISGDYLYKLCDLLQCTPDWLFHGKSTLPPPQLYLGGGLDVDAFAEVYKIFDDAAVATRSDYTSDIKSKCLIAMYLAKMKGDSPSAEMLRFLTAL